MKVKVFREGEQWRWELLDYDTDGHLSVLVDTGLHPDYETAMRLALGMPPRTKASR